MPKIQTHKQTDLEKRFKILQHQLYGKSANQQVSDSVIQQSSRPTDIPTHRYTDPPSHTEVSRTDLSYLKQDLSKIALLASLAIGFELILYFSQLTNRIKLF